MDGQSTAVPQRAPDHARLTAHYGWVRAVARNLVRDPWGAEDVTQETLLAALAAPPREVPDDQRLRAWLGRVAFNLSRLGARQGARRRAREVHVARCEALPSVTEELESAGTLSALSHAIAALPEPYREVVLMRYFDGLSTAEIATRTGASELAVRKRLWRARNKLRAALDHDPISGRLLAALLSWSGLVRRLPATGLGAAAAGLALLAGATWWNGRDEERIAAPSVALLEERPGELELAPGAGAPLAEEPDEKAPVRRSSVPTRHPTPPPSVPGRPQSVAVEEAPPVFAQGAVFDLEGRARAGFELFDSQAPEELLATSDASGGFRLPVESEPALVEARTPGWSTIVPARLVAGVEPCSAIVVASCLDLDAKVQDEAGRALPDAELTVCCDETTFVRIELPVHVESERLRDFQTDAEGRVHARDLPRGPGLTLRVEAPGYESREIETLALGDEEHFFLRSLGTPRFVAGRVMYRDGRPVAGAHVNLARASTSADRLGRYRLPLVGVRHDSSFEARDPSENAAPVELKGFGAQLSEDDEEVDLVLGEELDPVQGRLVGKDPAGWSVVAYPRSGARLDARGDEEPAASTQSTGDGRFSFRVPRGSYDLYVVAPDAPRVVRREALETRGGAWEVELPSDPVLQGFHAHLASIDGAPLARARVEVRLRQDGDLGPRRLKWRELTSDERGSVAFARDPSAPLELALAHASLGEEAVVVSAPDGAHAELGVPRAAYLQIAGARTGLTAAAVLDGEGRVLSVRGPLRTGQHVALRSGWSPVLEVPAEARWLALQQGAEEPELVPIEPHASSLLQVRP
jgi:RNA polymerase sigma-70 factor (ECF subfamily)